VVSYSHVAITPVLVFEVRRENGIVLSCGFELVNLPVGKTYLSSCTQNACLLNEM